MTAEMPDRITVGPYTYLLAIDNDAVREFGKQRDGDYAAFSEHGALDIRVADRDPDGVLFAPAVVRAAALHEAIHCVFHVAGWSGRAAVAAGADEVEEYTISAVEATLLGLVRGNPGFVAWLGS